MDNRSTQLTRKTSRYVYKIHGHCITDTILSKSFEGKLLWLEGKMVIRGKIYTITCLYTYIDDQQGYRL